MIMGKFSILIYHFTFFLKNTQFKEIFNHEGVGVVYSKVRFRSLKLIEFVEK